MTKKGPEEGEAVLSHRRRKCCSRMNALGRALPEQLQRHFSPGQHTALLLFWALKALSVSMSQRSGHLCAGNRLGKIFPGMHR